MSKPRLGPSVLGFLMLIAGAEAYFLTPRLEVSQARRPLSEVIPESFGEWHAIASPQAVIDPSNERQARDPFFTLYDDVLMRAYENKHGNVVLLALAYGKHQRQEFKIHRPELCYVAQGFRLLSHDPVVFPVLDGRSQPITGSRMLVQSQARVEIVSYWIRIGNRFSDSGWATRYYLMQEGIGGHVLDGILVRVSQVIDGVNQSTAGNYALQEEFLSELVRAAPAAASSLLIG
jgi:EpsI family protein